MIDAILVAAMMASLVAVAILVLWIRDRFYPRKLSSEERELRRQDRERRLRNPDWRFVAAEFGGSVPEGVESLYRDTDLIMSSGIEVTEYAEIAEFVPADDNAFDPEQWFNPASDAFVFATTPFGDPFFVKTSEATAGLPVYLLFHDGGDTERLTATLMGFLERLRTKKGRL